MSGEKDVVVEEEEEGEEQKVRPMPDMPPLLLLTLKSNTTPLLQVTLLELFSDLAFVVAIHVVAVPLEEAPDVFGTPMVVYALRVFVLWMAWYSGTLYTNIANLFVPGSDKLEGRHYSLVLVQIVMITMISQATTGDNDGSVIAYFLAVSAKRENRLNNK